ncbi:MAG TPA: biopolymer transporter ExbD [Verrucomicrobiae bacterium]|jgi:biopolymer transport protein ExbD|nr:biopolymer transporter ExbD [Verrucomicrobiae bacterium]
MKLSTPVQRRHSRIEIIPLIDIMFFLLASFMMVSLQLDRTSNTKVSLPLASEGRADYKPDMINIAVDSNGVVWLEKKRITLPQLVTALSNRFGVNTNLPVYISGDINTRHGNMVDVLQAVRRVGVQKVAFMVGGSPTTANTAGP